MEDNFLISAVAKAHELIQKCDDLKAQLRRFIDNLEDRPPSLLGLFAHTAVTEIVKPCIRGIRDWLDSFFEGGTIHASVITAIDHQELEILIDNAKQLRQLIAGKVSIHDIAHMRGCLLSIAEIFERSIKFGTPDQDATKEPLIDPVGEAHYSGLEHKSVEGRQMTKPYAYNFARTMWQLMDIEWSIVRMELYCRNRSSSETIKILLESAQKTIPFLVIARQYCHELEMRYSLAHIDRIIEELKQERPYRTWENLKSQINQIRTSIEEELKDQQFYYIATNVIGYFQPSINQIETVQRKLPSIGFDFSEAGKCLALGRATACVFHLMRVMEGAIQALGTSLGVVNTTEKTWGSLTTEMDNALKKKFFANLSAEQKAQQAQYATTLAHLNAVRIAWRNPTMHPKLSYTEEEGRDIFQHVSAFIQDVVTII